ncbi:MAG TPA: YbaN family protein [Deinococcales bacterium]|nr:YbaN family protein [Deinococcales bacterium]
MPSRPARILWLSAGFLLTAVGFIGALLPVLPSTVFFIGAAACFSRSSPRFERWLHGLPGVGEVLRDYAAGLGMRRRAKVVAIAMLTVAVTASALLAVPVLVGKVALLAVGAVGAWYIAFRVPTREVELARRGREG